MVNLKLKEKIKLKSGTIIKKRVFAWFPIKVYLFEPTDVTISMDKFHAFGYKWVWLEHVRSFTQILDEYGKYFNHTYYEFRLRDE